jgi:hypothetical protein
MSYDLIENTLNRVGEQLSMSSTNSECYRTRAVDCCRKAVIAEDVDQRSHWLEAAARWSSLAREHGSFIGT